MTKPHEQEWSAVPTVGDIRCGDRIVAVVVHEEDEKDLSVLIAAAPDMARALMDALEWDKRSRDCPEAAGRHPWEAMRAALRKAGVL